MPLPLFIARQGRCPSGFLGSLIARIMAWETSGENRMAVELLEIQPSDHVLEIGFGHGRTLALAAARATQGVVAGVDPSERMMRMASRHNHTLIAAGRMELKLGDSSQLPFPDRRFERVYSVHTLYFWKKPVEDLREIARVMRPGGRLVLGFRPKEDEAMRAAVPVATHRLYSSDEVGTLIKQAGFSLLRLVEHRFSSRRLVLFAVAQQFS